jgi:hypothetical protein
MQHDGIRLQQAGKKIGPIVTPRAAMMTARTSSNGNRRSACPSALQVMKPRSAFQKLASAPFPAHTPSPCQPYQEKKNSSPNSKLWLPKPGG